MRSLARIAKLVGFTVSLKFYVYAALTAFVLLGGWRVYVVHRQRSIGAERLIEKQREADRKTIEKKEKRDDELRTYPDRIIDIISGRRV